MTVVYLDTVFALNAALDYLLLLSAARLAAVPPVHRRLIAAALLGGVYAAAVFCPGLGALAHPAGRLACAALMVLAAFGWRRQSIRLLLLFLALSCALAGGLVLISLLWSGQLTYPRGIPVTSPDWKALLLSAALCHWLAASALDRLAPARGRELLPVRLRWAHREVSLTALRDTGNLLTAPDGRPVLVAYWRSVAPLLPDHPALRAEDVSDPAGGIARLGAQWGAGRLHLLPYRGIGAGRGLLLAVRVDSAGLNRQTVPRQMVALSPEPLSDGRYQAVIGC